MDVESLDKVFEEILVKRGGWDKFLLYKQEGVPVWAYRNCDRVDLDYVGIGTIHGTEQIGVLNWAKQTPKLIQMNRRILLMPFMNKWGYEHNQRYSPNGLSVGGMDELFNGRWTPETQESEKLAQFLIQQRVKGAKVLDIHEDCFWEDEEYLGRTFVDSDYSYLYQASRESTDNTCDRMVEVLRRGGTILPKSAITRFPGQRVEDGVVRNVEDGSVDHLLAFLGASTITTEITRRSPSNPSLEHRMNLQDQMVETFLE